MSLRSALNTLGLTIPFSWRRDLSSAIPESMRQILAAAVDPQVGDWKLVESTSMSNRPFTEEINGLVTDGTSWFASVNANDDREGVYRLRADMRPDGFVRPPLHPDAVHLGALSVRGGRLYVPLQERVFGVWVLSVDRDESHVAVADELPHDDMFAWCDVHPLNGLLYTSNFTMPDRLDAYELEGARLTRRARHDLTLEQPADHPTTRVQSGCFTPNHKWIAVCDVDGAERVHVYSALTGAFLGRRWLRAEADESNSILGTIGVTDTRNELEGIWYHPMTRGDRTSQVHVLELNNEELSTDDFVLWHLGVPEGAL